MTERPPTDTQILKAFQEYEKSFNVAMRALQLVPSELVRSELDYRLYSGHGAFRQLALDAQERKDAKKGGKT